MNWSVGRELYVYSLTEIGHVDTTLSTPSGWVSFHHQSTIVNVRREFNGLSFTYKHFYVKIISLNEDNVSTLIQHSGLKLCVIVSSIAINWSRQMSVHRCWWDWSWNNILVSRWPSVMDHSTASDRVSFDRELLLVNIRLELNSERFTDVNFYFKLDWQTEREIVRFSLRCEMKSDKIMSLD